MGKQKGTYYLTYKYPGEAWTEYDRTRDKGWAELQEERMKKEHPAADLKVELK